MELEAAYPQLMRDFAVDFAEAAYANYLRAVFATGVEELAPSQGVADFVSIAAVTAAHCGVTSAAESKESVVEAFRRALDIAVEAKEAAVAEEAAEADRGPLFDLFGMPTKGSA